MMLVESQFISTFVRRSHRSAVVAGLWLLSAVTIGLMLATSGAAAAAGSWQQSPAEATRNTLTSVYFVGQDNGWAVGAGGVILHTSDGGKTWAAQVSGTSQVLRSVDFTDALNGWVAGDNGTLLHTLDGGVTWTKKSVTTLSLASVQFVDASNGIVTEAPTERIFRTGDGGATWRSYPTAWMNIHSYKLVSASTIWAIGHQADNQSDWAWKSVDGGNLWAAAQVYTTVSFNALDSVDASVGWVAGDSGTIMHTTDGLNWSAQISGTSKNLVSLRFVDMNYGWAVGDEGAIVHTSDGGAHWTAQASGTNVTLLSVHPIDRYRAWAVGERGVILSTSDGGTTWCIRRVPEGSLRSVRFISAAKGCAVGDGGAVWTTVDGGVSWTARNAGTADSLYAVDFADAVSGVAVGDYGTILKTADGGVTWARSNSGTSNRLFSIRFADQDTGWAVGAQGKVLRTVDGGASWASQDSGTSVDLYSVDFVDARTGWAVGSDGAILGTVDGGSVWTRLSPSSTAQLHGVDFVDDKNGWAVGSDGTILSTADGGASWTPRTSGITTSLESVSFLDSSQGVAVGLGGVILRTVDGGATWVGQQSGTTSRLRSAHFINSSVWAAGDSGVILTADTGAPTTSLIFTAPDGVNGWWRHAPSITASVSKPAITFYSWIGSSGPWTIWSSPVTAAEGTSTIYYRSVSNTGDTETVGRQSFSVDSMVASPGGVVATATTTVGSTISWTPVVDVVSGLDHYTAEVLTAAGSPIASAVTTGAAAGFTGLSSDTSYVARVTAFDKAGNSQSSTAVAFKTLKAVTPPPPPPPPAPAAPVFVNPVVPLGWSNHDVTVHLETTPDSGQTMITYSVNGGPTQTYAGSIQVSAEGTTTITYQATNEAGVSTETKTLTILIDKSPPSIATTPTVATRTVDAVTLSWAQATDAVSGAIRYDIYDNGVLVGTTRVTSITLTGLAPGVHSFVVAAVDAAGGVSSPGGATVVEVAFVPPPLASVLTPVPSSQVPTVPADTRLVTGFDPRSSDATGSVNIEMPYDRNLSDERAANLSVMAWIDSHWVRIPCIVDLVRHTVRFTLPRPTRVVLVEPSNVDATSRIIAAATYSQNAYGAQAQIRVNCVNAYNAPLFGRVIKLYMNAGASSKAVTMTANSQLPGTYEVSVRPIASSGPTHLSFIFNGDSITAGSSATSVLMPKAKLTLGRTVTSIRAGAKVRVSGTLAPFHRSTAKVTLAAERIKDGKVVTRTSKAIYLAAGNNAFSTGIALKTRGNWRIRLAHSDSTHCTSYSAYRYISVK